MKKNPLSNRTSRRGFTLVEMVVTIAIISVLAGLVVGGIMVLMNKGPEAQARAEIKNLETGLGGALKDLGGQGGSGYLPSHLILREDNEYYTDRAKTQVNPRYVATVNALTRAFGRYINLKPATVMGGQDIDWNQDGQIARGQPPNGDFVMEGQHCLVFWTGGVQAPWIQRGAANQTASMVGFSTDPQNPASAPVAGQARRGPYANFQQHRLIRDPNAGNMPYYQDPFSKNQPYAYFSTSKSGNDYNPSDCSSLLRSPYFISTNAAGQTKWANPSGFQIITAGLDGVFGPGGLLPETSKPGGIDNLANFQSSALGSKD